MDKKQTATAEEGGEEYFLFHMIVSQVMRLYFQRSYVLLERMRLHPGQVPVIMALSRDEGLSQRELSERLTVRPSTMAVTLRRMEKNGLVYRIPDQKDQRVSRVYLSEKGQTLFERMREMLEDLGQECMAGFTGEEIRELKQLMNRIRENLAQLCDEDSPPCGDPGRRGGELPRKIEAHGKAGQASSQEEKRHAEIG